MKFKILGYLDTDEPDNTRCSKCGLIGGCPCDLGFKVLTHKT